MTFKECVGIIVAMFVAFLGYAFVKAAVLTVREQRAPSDGTVFLREDAVDVDALARRTNGKARVTVEWE